MNFQSEKFDVQIALLKVLALHISGIDAKLGALNNLIVRAQNDVYPKLEGCNCNTAYGKISTLLQELEERLK